VEEVPAGVGDEKDILQVRMVEAGGNIIRACPCDGHAVADRRFLVRPRGYNG
jgi:hypothetical protein